VNVSVRTERVRRCYIGNRQRYFLN
jgi:hypothetical protein